MLSTWAHGRSLPLRLIQRAQIVAMAAEGVPSQDIAQRLEVSRPTVQLWRERFLALRLEGLKKDAPRPGRIPSIPEKKVRAVVQATLHTTPRGATHWSIRTMAKAQGISRMAVQRIWDPHGLKPHLTRLSSSAATNVLSKSSTMWSAFISTLQTRPWSCASTRKAKSRHSIVPSQDCRSRRGAAGQ